ncbi:TetR/AcrR family transcriptional regulator [Mycolicibacterium goodii]|uniref:TetR family transcriptional regulator n=1 Tax=Mycolicibacterium goodii TaxID=134601 RepID=UPI001BDC7846|nr:TetR family transcriptional regulator [Mycolicibacterium goodii]MBU8817942.1 TetR/AcrR family transcriptional regulator [Mycolicibacterium goodii]
MAYEVQQLGLRERKKQRTRAMLISAAIDLFARQGYKQTTVEQIAASAEVSARTFSRYFATKDAVMLAFLDDLIALVASELAQQPPELGDLDAVCRAHISAFEKTRVAVPGQLTEDRLVAGARIFTSSASLIQAAMVNQPAALSEILAKRMGVAADDRRLALVSSVWNAIITTAMVQLGRNADWATVTVERITNQIRTTYVEFMEVTGGVRELA